MSYEPTSDRALTRPTKVSITAASAIKIGFLGAFGWFLFSLLLSVIAVVVALVAGVSFGNPFTQLGTLGS